jgi:hypothetical protein
MRGTRFEPVTPGLSKRSGRLRPFALLRKVLLIDTFESQLFARSEPERTVGGPRDLLISDRFRVTAEDETLLSRYDLFDIRHGNNKRAVAEEPAPDEEVIGPIEARAEPNRFDRAKTPSRRVDPEAFAAAQPVVLIPREVSGKLEVARHQHSLLRERQVLLSRRSRSAKLVCASGGSSQERLLLAVAHAG